MPADTTANHDLLRGIGVDLFYPETAKEHLMADAFESFSRFVLEDEKASCEEIIGRHIGKSVGELQGGSNDFDIYRVMIGNEDSDEDGAASTELFDHFLKSNQGLSYSALLTEENIRQFMLKMCNRRSERRGSLNRYDRLGNMMLIFTFGETPGQVRHIDNMDPNLQVCLYMSENCPGTIVYEMEEPEITNTQQLVSHWEALPDRSIPDLLKSTLLAVGSMPLGGKFHTRDFSSWETIDNNLETFGKLYQDVFRSFETVLEPGTTLVAAGNQVHAGPPTTCPRMFAFAIGIPSLESLDQHDIVDDDNNGEVQYSPVLLHVDLCRILFGIFDYDLGLQSKDDRDECKRFLLQVLVHFIESYPNEPFDRLIPDDYADLRGWLIRLVEVRHDKTDLERHLLQGIACDMMFFSAGVRRQRCKRSRRKIGKSAIRRKASNSKCR